ncbi:MAG: coenzyme F420-0:L-glutamate ligase [Candidatus Beckwithbacteria bacterium]|nr:coenzyme F420-0:L-glutamate ligase [Candidatus Beckwithbacteria bacterium]
MKFLPIKTRKFLPPKDDLYNLLDEYLSVLKDKDILVITSKIVSISQGRTVRITPTTDRIALIKQEADAYLPDNPSSMTVKDHTLTPFAGIDRSNANGYYVLWPKNPHLEAKKIWAYLTKKFSLKHLGIIIADSFCLPFRWGHLGIAIGFFGLNPVYFYTDKTDIFNRPLVRASSNLIDALSALAVVHMGEGNEQTPLCLIRGYSKIQFDQKDHTQEFFISPRDDLYTPFLKNLKK